MASRIIMPKQGLQMTEGLITNWLKKEGDKVKAGEPLFEMETDKLTITIDSTAEGTLLKILHPAGDTVPITETIALIGQAGEQIEPPKQGDALPGRESFPEAEQPKAAMPRREEKVFISPRAKMRAEEMDIDTRAVSGSGPDGLIIERDVLQAEPSRGTASPLAKKVAALHDVALDGITGTGVRGKVMAEDVYGALHKPEETNRDTVIPLKGMRRIIAQHMKASLDTMAQANHRMQVDMSEAVRLREQLKNADIKISYNDIIIKCAAKALSEFPMLNATMTDTDIIQKHDINIGMAVATDNGLLVPAIRHADRLAIQAIAQCSLDLGKRAKENKLSPDELTGGTFTVTNLGMYDVDSFTAIINAPEAAILAVGAIKKQPVVLKDDTIGVRPMMWLSLTYDHRIVDGAPAAQFLKRIKTLLEKPFLLL